MSDQEDVQKRPPKSRRAKRLQEKREPKLDEEPRRTLFIRGVKSSENIRALLQDWYILKKSYSTFFSRKHDIQPFENHHDLEEFCRKEECSLFCMASHSKKRPNNLTIGRTYDHQILDMVELGLKEFKSQEEFGKLVEVAYNSRPLIIFNGDVFGYQAIHMKLHNLLTDFFFENCKTEAIASSNDLNLIISVNGSEDQISITVYQRQMINQDDQISMKVEEIGPRCVFEIRRSKLADDEVYKRACRVPKPKKKPHEKNIKHDEVGDKRGRVFVQQQDLSTLALKKRKKIKKYAQKLKVSVQQQKQLEQEQGEPQD